MVVSLRSIKMVIILAQLNYLDLWVADIGNTYLVEVYAEEKLHIIAGPEFKELEGHLSVIVRALCRTRTAGGRWHSFQSCSHMN